ncbi:MAG: hypothetical protein AAGI71_12325 [Bacteroidota bacterium]
MPDAPTPDAPTSPVKPIGRRASKALVIAGILFVFGISALSTYLLLFYNTDTEVLEQLDDARDQIRSEIQAQRDSLAATQDSVSVSPPR